MIKRYAPPCGFPARRSVVFATLGFFIPSASAIGIWMDHKTYSSSTAWQSCTVSVSTIQEYTGFDFFANLPDNVEAVAESNTSWAEFQNF